MKCKLDLFVPHLGELRERGKEAERCRVLAFVFNFEINVKSQNFLTWVVASRLEIEFVEVRETAKLVMQAKS